MSRTIARAVTHGPIRNHNPWYFFDDPRNLVYAARTAATGIACLLVGMYLQLQVPRWTILTVVIVSPPVRGNALRKTLARIIGTAIGCIVGLIFVSLFAQDRIGFTIAFAAWLGSCAYWATLKRGFIAYGAVLAAFTCALIASDVPIAPQDTFTTVIHRGAATILGVIFAWLASEVAARSDDAPGDFTDRVCEIACELLGWAHDRLDPAHSADPEDAPFAARILAIDELAKNAMAERPAMHWVRPWITGLPTALLSLQSESLVAARQLRAGNTSPCHLDQIRSALSDVAAMLSIGRNTSIQALRQQCSLLVQLRSDIDHAAARDSSSVILPTLGEITSALLYLVAAIEAVLLLKDPENVAARTYPPLVFFAQHRRAVTNMLRAVVGILLGFAIYDITAWSDGPFFLVNIAVAMVIYLQLDNPLTLNTLNLVGVVAGGIVGLVAKHMFLPISNDPVWLAIVLFPLMFVGSLILVRTELTAPAITFVFVTLTILELDNPQKYDFRRELNTFMAFAAAYAFVPVVFLLVGAPKAGLARVEELLERMRLHLRRAERKPFTSRRQQMEWETCMYDALQQLQAEVKSPIHRATAVDLLLSGRRFTAPHAIAPAADRIESRI
jgi:uncharacterized membrane protein YccC